MRLLKTIISKTEKPSGEVMKAKTNYTIIANDYKSYEKRCIQFKKIIEEFLKINKSSIKYNHSIFYNCICLNFHLLQSKYQEFSITDACIFHILNVI